MVLHEKAASRGLPVTCSHGDAYQLSLLGKLLQWQYQSAGVNPPLTPVPVCILHAGCRSSQHTHSLSPCIAEPLPVWPTSMCGHEEQEQTQLHM